MNALPEGYSIEAPTIVHSYKVNHVLNDDGTVQSERIDNVENPVTHYIVRGSDGENVNGKPGNAQSWEPWHSLNIDAIECAWGHYNGALIDKHNEGLEGNMQTLGVYIVEDESHPEWRKEYHAECIKHRQDNLLELEAITIWDEGQDIQRLICHHCSEPICPDELVSKYRLEYEPDHELLHAWAIEDGEEWNGEYDKYCQHCQDMDNTVDADEENSIAEERSIEEGRYNF